MKKIIVIALAIGLIGVGLLFFTQGSSSPEVTQTAEFGTWGQKMTFVYRDGSTSNDLLSFLHEDEPVNKVIYNLKASASSTQDSDFTQVEFDTSELKLQIGVQNNQIGTEIVQNKMFSQNPIIDIDGNSHKILTTDFFASNIPSSVQNNDYTFFMKLDGNLRYRGVYSAGTGDWKDCIIPQPLTAGISIGPAGDVSVDLDQDTDYDYGEEEDNSWKWDISTHTTLSFTQEQLDCAQDAYGSLHTDLLAEYHPEIVFHTCGSPDMWLFEGNSIYGSGSEFYDFQYVSVRFQDRNVQIQPDTQYSVNTMGETYELVIPKQ